MQIILMERVDNLGQMGDVVDVKAGYARNFLLPRHKALRATKANIEYFESRRKDIEATNLEKRKEAEAVSTKIDGASCTLIRQAGESGQLYGSVSPRDIVASLAEQGYTVDRTQIRLDRPIKELGIHEVRVALHPEVNVTVSVNVARTDEEALRQVSDATEAELEAEQFFESEEVARQALEEIEEAEAANPDGEEIDEDEDRA